MRSHFVSILASNCLFLMLMFCSDLAAQASYSLHDQSFVQCSQAPETFAQANFSGPSCNAVTFKELDPQGKELWLHTTLPNKPLVALSHKPIGIYLMGKAASSVYVNGEKLGENGLANSDPKQEIPGNMDHVYYLPKKYLKAENNQLLIHLSSHHNYLNLHRPMHYLGIGEYADSKASIQSHKSLGLIFLGMFILSTLYFGGLSLKVKHKSFPRLLLAMSAFAGCQLAVEISRGLINYAYPVHDLRLIAICLLALGFSLSLLTLVSNQFAGSQKLHWIYGGTLITVVAILSFPGFDTKTTFALAVPVVVSVIVVILALKKQFSWRVMRYLTALLAFVFAFAVTFQYFHELVFYLIVAVLLAYLFVQQAREYSSEIAASQTERTLRAKLEFKLGQMQQQTQSETINIEGAGKIDKIATQDILYCQAAGDYVELFLNNRELLFSGSLKRMTELLPDTFVRVHRSYIVNLDKVTCLKREGENGYLQLSNDSRIPVSRRMMPNVKKSLNAK